MIYYTYINTPLLQWRLLKSKCLYIVVVSNESQSYFLCYFRVLLHNKSMHYYVVCIILCIVDTNSCRHACVPKDINYRIVRPHWPVDVLYHIVFLRIGSPILLADALCIIPHLMVWEKEKAYNLPWNVLRNYVVNWSQRNKGSFVVMLD